MSKRPDWIRAVPPAEPATIGVAVTEDVLARDFISRNCLRLRWDNTRGRWYVYDLSRGVWRCDDTGAVVLEDLRRFCAERDDAKKPKLGGKSTIFAIEALCRVDMAVAITSDFWDRHPLTLATPGAYINLQTGTVQPPNPDDMITQSTIVALEDGEPQRFLTFLHEATGGDTAYVDYIQRLSGYCLTGDIREHALFFIHGPQGTGKSRLIAIMQEILGSYSGTAPMKMFTRKQTDSHPTGVAMLRGKRLVAANETQQGWVWDEALIKNLTGGDRIAARFMHQNFFEFTPTHKLVFSSNFAPAIQSSGEGLRRRFQILPFDRTPRFRDEHLHAKFVMEAGQILGWMVRGALQWQQMGLAPPKIVQDATAAYFERQDVFADWLDAATVRGPNCRSPTERLYTTYVDFMNRQHEPVLSMKSFATELRQRGFLAVKFRVDSQTLRGWQGVQPRLQFEHYGDQE